MPEASGRLVFSNVLYAEHSETSGPLPRWQGFFQGTLYPYIRYYLQNTNAVAYELNKKPAYSTDAVLHRY